MKKIKFICLTVPLILFFLITSASAIQYGNDLISVGDLKSKVFTICGEPISKDVIGYIDHVESEKRIRVMKIEEWVIEVNIYNSVYYYSLVFEGNKLTEITSVGKKK